MNAIAENPLAERLEQDIRAYLEDRSDLPKIPLLGIEMNEEVGYDGSFRLRLYLIVPDEFFPKGSWDAVKPYFQSVKKPIADAIRESVFFTRLVAERAYDAALVLFKEEHEQNRLRFQENG